MKKVVVFLADGAEEIEALSPVDMLRRAGADVTLAGVGKKEIICAHNVKIVCDKELSEISWEDFDMYVLPGCNHGFGNAGRFFEYQLWHHFAKYLMGDDSAGYQTDLDYFMKR